MKFFCYFSLSGLSNTYLFGPDEGGDAVLVDPGAFDVPLLQLIEDNHLYIKHILITHSHNSHIEGIKTILKIYYEATVYANTSSIMDFKTVKISHNEELKLGDYKIRVIETPGHSGDSVVFHIEKFLFTGDTIFAGTIGSTRDRFARELLVSVIREHIMKLEDECFIFPGHGPPSKVGIERLLNPYI